jgi:tetratricopeptide (TPR) repeat protein
MDFKVEHLAVAKINLTKLILRSLRMFYEGNSAEHRVLSMLLEAEILRKKGLYKQAIKHLDKAKEMARHYEMHFHIFEILNRLVFIHIDTFGKGTEKRLKELLDEIEQLQVKTEKEARLQALAYKMILLIFTKPLRDPSTVDEIAKIEAQLQAFQVENDDTFFSKLFYFVSHGSLSRVKGQHAATNKHFEKVMELWERNPHIRDMNSRVYKNYITTYLNSFHMLENYSVFDEWLEKFASIPDTNFDEEAGSFKDYYHITLLYLLNTAQLTRALSLVPKIEAGLELYKAKINKSRETTLRFNIFLVFFLNEKFSEALDWLGTMELDHKLEARADPRSLARIMRVIVHYELGHNRILDDLRTSVYRKLKKEVQLHEFERAILEHIRQLELAPDKKSKQVLFEELIVKLNAIGDKFGMNNVLGLEEIICWAESRLQNKPYIKVIEARKKH